MELIESIVWVAVGFGPTIAALVGISKAIGHSRAEKRESTALGSLEAKEDLIHVR